MVMISDVTAELQDEQHVSSNTAQVMRLLEQSGLSEHDLVQPAPSTTWCSRHLTPAPAPMASGPQSS
jgi:hypothetical protein